MLYGCGNTRICWRGNRKGGKVNSDEMQIAADLCREMAANGPTKGRKEVRARQGSEREREGERCMTGERERYRGRIDRLIDGLRGQN